MNPARQTMGMRGTGPRDVGVWFTMATIAELIS
jgi:hypothetical protein